MFLQRLGLSWQIWDISDLHRFMWMPGKSVDFLDLHNLLGIMSACVICMSNSSWCTYSIGLPLAEVINDLAELPMLGAFFENASSPEDWQNIYQKYLDLTDCIKVSIISASPMDFNTSPTCFHCVFLLRAPQGICSLVEVSSCFCGCGCFPWTLTYEDCVDWVYALFSSRGGLVQ